MPDKPLIAVAIETTCRTGGVALAVDGRTRKVIAFDAARRHATQLVARLADLLAGEGLAPADISELYVSAGPGSFTGTRVGITVARTLGQLHPALRCALVPTPRVVLQAAASLPWQHLAVVLDAGKGLLHATGFARQGESILQQPPLVGTAAEFLAAPAFPRPLALIGEGLAFHNLEAPGISLLLPASDPRHLPTPDSVLAVGLQMSAAGDFTDYRLLLPHYARAPEAVRLWEQRNP